MAQESEVSTEGAQWVVRETNAPKTTFTAVFSVMLGDFVVFASNARKRRLGKKELSICSFQGCLYLTTTNYTSSGPISTPHLRA